MTINRVIEAARIHKRSETREGTKIEAGEQGICKYCNEVFVFTPSKARRHDFICRLCSNALKLTYGSRPGRPYAQKKEYEARRTRRPEVRERKAAQQREYLKNPALRKKHEVRWLTSRAINAGRLQRKPCEVCGEMKVDAHHPDYTKPYDVRWLCRQHHADAHRLERSGP